jgi:hypothetical protein
VTPKGHYPKWRPKTEAEQRAAHAKKLASIAKARQTRFPPDPYRKLVAAVRQACQDDPALLGQLAKIAHFTGGREDTRKAQHAARERVRRFLRKEFPLEIWQVSTVRTPDTWSDRELWVAYGGVHPSKAAADRARAARKAQWDKGRRVGGRYQTPRPGQE